MQEPQPKDGTLSDRADRQTAGNAKNYATHVPLHPLTPITPPTGIAIINTWTTATVVYLILIFWPFGFRVHAAVHTSCEVHRFVK